MRFHSFVFFLFVTTIALCQTDVEIAGELYSSYLIAREKGNIYESYQILNQILESDFDLPDYNVAVLHSSLGVAAKNLGLYQIAKESYILGLEHCANQTTRDQNLYIDILINQGILYRHLGDYSLAIEYYEEVERLLIEESYSSQDYQERFALVLLNKSMVIYDLKKYSDALSLLFQSKEIKEEHDFTNLGSVYYNIARSYQALNNTTQAEYYYNASIGQWIEEHDTTYYQLGDVYRDYGQFLIQMGSDNQGLEYYDRAVEIFVQNYGEKHTYISDCHNHIAQYYLGNYEYEEALSYLQKALISICPGYNDENIFSNPVNLKPSLDICILETYILKLKALKGLAIRSSLNSRSMEVLNFALETVDEAFHVLSRIQNSYLSRESRLFLIGNNWDFFIHGIDAALQLYEFTGLSHYKEKAYEYASLSKSIELIFEINEKNLMYMNNEKEDSISKFRSLQEQIYSLTNLIFEAEAIEDSGSDQIDQMKQELFILRRSFENVHQEFFGNSFDTISEIKSSYNPLTDLQSNLSNKNTVIEFAVGEIGTDGRQMVYTFVITKNSCEISQRTVDSGFANNIQNIYNSFSSINQVSSPDNIDDQLLYSLHDFYIALFQPIEKWVRTKNLTIIPDGELILIPFDLLVRDIDSLRSYADQDFLLYDYAIGYAPNSTMIKKLDYVFNRKPPNVLAIAPDFTKSEQGGYSVINSSLEIEEILNQFNGEGIPDFDAKNNSHRIDKGRILHFATHSVASPEFTGSPYLVLGSGEDSKFRKLFDFEISKLDLESPMVVVNSCESGKGAYYKGEGMFSISRSFLVAGASSVIHTLWPMEDISSSRIIIEYYEHLSKGQSKTEALRKAKIEYLASTPNSFTHPHYWAGFQVIGDPYPIVNQQRVIKTFIGIFAFLLLIVVIRRGRARNWPVKN